MTCAELSLPPTPLPQAGEGMTWRRTNSPLARLRERGRGRGWLLALLLLLTVQSQAAIENQDFNDESERVRFYQLTRELRCPKCQNQDIADSNAPIAADLRREIRRLLGEGQTNEQITAHMVSRYGEFVRYKPALNRHTLLLWFGPALLLAIGLLGLLIMIVRRKRALTQSAALSGDEQARLNALLKETPDA